MKTDLLRKYQIDPNRGFLPNPDPLQQLASKFEPWDQLGKSMPKLLLKGEFRSAVEKLPLIDSSIISDGPELGRAMLLLSMFANAFISCGPEPERKIPRPLAIPLANVAKRSGRPPIASHASIVLNNWRRIDKDGSIELENLKTVQNFLGGQDEDWFFLTTVAIEFRGASAIIAALEGLDGASTSDDQKVDEAFEKVEKSIESCIEILDRIPEKCSPKIFYSNIRPFLTGWPTKGIVYEGVSDKPKVYIGGSAAQSSLLQSIDTAIGITHLHADSGPFLDEMRKYMPPPHREFIKYLETQPSLKNYVEQGVSSELKDALNRCVSKLESFRKKHMQIVVHYILDQANDDEEVIGTGGTEFVNFLTRTKSETSGSLIL